MPASITKNRLSHDTINTMVRNAFQQDADSITELTEGFFNIAYKITMKDKEVILKIAPSSTTEIMTHEINIMYSEVEAMNMVEHRTKVPVPKILFYDDSQTLCDSSYFFMEMLEGCSFSSCKFKMSEIDQEKIFYEIGKYTKTLNQILNKKFGYFGQEDKQGENWYLVFRNMIKDAYYDAKAKNIEIPILEDNLLAMLEKERLIFEQVKEASFVHWDIWAGNVFVKDSEIVGIIDFERCLWADKLMEVGFRTYGYEKAFFHGYGIEGLDEEETRRAKWYDIYLFLILCLECDYRMYDNRGTYQWACSMLTKWVEELGI